MEEKIRRKELAKQMWQDCEAFLKEMTEKYQDIIIKDSPLLEYKKKEYVSTWKDKINRENGFKVLNYPTQMFNISFEIIDDYLNKTI